MGALCGQWGSPWCQWRGGCGFRRGRGYANQDLRVMLFCFHIGIRRRGGGRGIDSEGGRGLLSPRPPFRRHRGWVDACARLFGGIDICGVEALRGPDGREHIVQVLGSWMPLVGPGAAEDRGRIVELVLSRMRAELPRPRSPSPARLRPPTHPRCFFPPTGAPPPSGPAQPRPQPQGQPRP
uniref:Synapsin ATP-binding domain-containing protein n=1 Tax=Amazona collaria TaxID=241587 RepID=A0A8B9G2Q5_9PSIT